MRFVLTCTVAWTLAATITPAGESSFSAKPAASRDGEKVKSTFTVSAPTDLEVAVLDSAGKVRGEVKDGQIAFRKK